MMENLARHPLPPCESRGHRPRCQVALAHQILLILTVAGTALFAVACGGQQVGELQRQSHSVDVQQARSVRTDLEIGAGELNLTGGADRLMEADFVYNVADWEPKVNYDVSGDTGELSVQQGQRDGPTIT